MFNIYLKKSGYVLFLLCLGLILFSFILLISSPTGGIFLAPILFSIPFLIILLAGVLLISRTKILPFLYILTSSIALYYIYNNLLPSLGGSNNGIFVYSIILSLLLFIFAVITLFTKPYMKQKKCYIVIGVSSLVIILMAFFIFFLIFSKVVLINPQSIILTSI